VYASGKTKQYGTFSNVEFFAEFKFINIMVILLQIRSKVVILIQNLNFYKFEISQIIGGTTDYKYINSIFVWKSKKKFFKTVVPCPVHKIINNWDFPLLFLMGNIVENFFFFFVLKNSQGAILGSLSVEKIIFQKQVTSKKNEINVKKTFGLNVF
jgi:hypothetical protein